MSAACRYAIETCTRVCSYRDYRVEQNSSFRSGVDRFWEDPRGKSYSLQNKAALLLNFVGLISVTIFWTHDQSDVLMVCSS